MRTVAPLSMVMLTVLLGRGAPRAQQVADSSFVPRVRAPAYPSAGGPVVAVDAAHGNFHTLRDRYEPFGEILRADGYRVIGNSEPFTSASLADISILVIANAGTAGDVSWQLPTPSAFSDAEIAAVVQWVRDGGALFLIADHMPAAGAASRLASAFGVRFTNGYTYAPRGGLPGDIFTLVSGKLADHAVTRGRYTTERVDSVISFTGQAFQVETPIDTVLRYGSDAISYLPLDAEADIDDQTPRVASPGWVHGAVLYVGRGRVAVFGEAAMFSAQVAGPKSRPMGLNHPLARNNQQFLLNIMHWLSGLLE